jgi:hypothetical protein
MLQSRLVVFEKRLWTLAERLFVLASPRRTLQSTSSCVPLCFRERRIPFQEGAAFLTVLRNLEVALLLELGETAREISGLRSRLQSDASVAFVLQGRQGWVWCCSQGSGSIWTVA